MNNIRRKIRDGFGKDEFIIHNNLVTEITSQINGVFFGNVEQLIWTNIWDATSTIINNIEFGIQHNDFNKVSDNTQKNIKQQIQNHHERE